MTCLGIYQNQALYQTIISISNYQATYLTNLSEIDHLSTFDILLIDISEMQAENYMPLVQRFKEQEKPKIILLKEAFSLEEVKNMMRAGVADCLPLPVDPPSLLTIIQKIAADIEREAKKREKEKYYTLRSVREVPAYDLIYGNTKHAKEIWERIQLANISLIPNTVLALSIDHFAKHVENKGELWKNLLREEVLSAIKACDGMYQTLKVLVREDKYAFLLALPVQADEEDYKILATEYADKIRNEVSRQTDYTVTIGIGNYYEDPRNLHLSYQESEQAQTYRFYSAENTVIHIKDLNYFTTPTYDEERLRIQEMTEKFSLGNIDAVLQEWERIYQSVQLHHHFRPEDFRLQLIDLLFSLSKSAMQNGVNPKKMVPLQINHAKKIHTLETLAEIDHWIKEIIHQYHEHVKERHNENVLKSVQEVMQFTEEHFSSDIGLDVVAEQVGLSPNYVSAIFKQTVGSSFTDYLTELRMNKAKEKLQDLNNSIQEIADAVGYSSSQYFSRVFKNHVGMTPTAYRNSLLTTEKY